MQQRLMSKTGKHSDELVIGNASADHRRKMEEYELITKSTPAHEKWGAAYWAMSLRGNAPYIFIISFSMSAPQFGAVSIIRRSLSVTALPYFLNR